MKKHKYETRILPSHLACYLINGDLDGYEDSEIEEIDSYLNSQGLGGCVGVDIENTYFKWSNDLNNLGADVCEFTFIKSSLIKS